ncbi:hypothetical protein J2S22_001125 [Rhodoplanes tepidamans]|nr:hypothetical protein [Rhodoplanes tepidamans]
MGVETIYREKCREALPGKIYTALYRSDRDLANRRGIGVRKARRAYEDQRFPLIVRQLHQAGAKLHQLHLAVLLGRSVMTWGRGERAPDTARTELSTYSTQLRDIVTGS